MALKLIFLLYNIVYGFHDGKAFESVTGSVPKLGTEGEEEKWWW